VRHGWIGLWDHETKVGCLMKAYEFDTRLAKNEIPIPPEVADQIPEGTEVRVILLLRTGEDESWRQSSLDSFADAYVDDDAIYESLIDEPLKR
jgi:hypothetical protein